MSYATHKVSDVSDITWCIKSIVSDILQTSTFLILKFFEENGFYYVHTPITTTSDCEGAGEMFQVGNLSTMCLVKL